MPEIIINLSWWNSVTKNLRRNNLQATRLLGRFDHSLTAKVLHLMNVPNFPLTFNCAWSHNTKEYTRLISSLLRFDLATKIAVYVASKAKVINHVYETLSALLHCEFPCVFFLTCQMTNDACIWKSNSWDTQLTLRFITDSGLLFGFILVAESFMTTGEVLK